MPFTEKGKNYKKQCGEKMRRYLWTGFVFFIAGFAIQPSGGPTSAPAHHRGLFEIIWPSAYGASLTSKQIETRIERIHKFIYTSSAAKHIFEHGNDEAKKSRETAVDLYNQAVATFEAGDNETSSRLLSEAWKKMYEGVKLSNTSSTTMEKRRNVVKKRLKSVRALLKAQKRVFAEKHGESAANELAARSEEAIEEAISLRDGGKIIKAQKRLKGAYHELTASIREMREGETKRRILKFETKEEEFQYEKNKNHSLRMLVDEIKGKKKPSERALKKIEELVVQGMAIRKAAEKQAEAGDFEKAIDTIGGSSSKFIRAIRAAGVYVPG